MIEARKLILNLRNRKLGNIKRKSVTLLLKPSLKKILTILSPKNPSITTSMACKLMIMTCNSVKKRWHRDNSIVQSKKMGL